tara:strand:+ start:5049 stop:5315 length:267 start_codon:yes stop_codon:yes gene_type:complete
MYSVELTTRVHRFIEKHDNATTNRIEKSLKRLEQNPVPSDAKFIGRISNEKVFRIRIGMFRALFSVNEKFKVVLVHKIDKRARVYDRQ